MKYLVDWGNGDGLTKDEVVLLASLKGSTVWGPLLKLLNHARAEAVGDVMDIKRTPDEQQLSRGAFRALSELEGELSDTLPAAALEGIRGESQSPGPETHDAQE